MIEQHWFCSSVSSSVVTKLASVSSFVQRIFWAFKFWVESFFWVHQIDLTLHALLLMHSCLSVWKSLVWFLLCWSLIPPICEDVFCSTQLLQSECWLKTLQTFSLVATTESCTQRWLKLQLGESLWQATTMAVTSRMQEQDEEMKMLRHLTLTVDISQCDNMGQAIRLRYCNSGYACADCTHTFTSPLNPKTPAIATKLQATVQNSPLMAAEPDAMRPFR